MAQHAIQVMSPFDFCSLECIEYCSVFDSFLSILLLRWWNLENCNSYQRIMRSNGLTGWRISGKFHITRSFLDFSMQVFHNSLYKDLVSLFLFRDWCISRQLWWGHRIPAYRVTIIDQVNFNSERRPYSLAVCPWVCLTWDVSNWAYCFRKYFYKSKLLQKLHNIF